MNLIKVLHLKWSCVFDSIAWWNNCSLTRISFSHIYCTPDLYPFKRPYLCFIFHVCTGVFFGKWKLHQKCQFLFLLILQNCQLSHCDQFISLLCPNLTHCDPRKSPIFPIFVIRFCDRPIYCPIYRPIWFCDRPIYRPKGHLHRIYLSVRLDSLAAPRAWAVFLAKTSRTAVPTAIMPIIAGGRLYKCLYKMHVDSRAFWGAFWGAFRVFLIDVGWGENKMAAMAPWNPRLLRNRQLCVGNKTFLKKNILAVWCFVYQWYPSYTVLQYD